MSRQHVVITGAAEGIGRALTDRYLAAGRRVSAIDVETEALDRLVQLWPAGRVRPLAADLTVGGDLATVERHLSEGPPIDLMIHNAGISSAGPFAESDIERQKEVVALNLHAPIRLTTFLLREGLLAPAASLVFVASLSVFTSYPGAAGYAASKAGLSAYARSLRVAIGPQGFHVLTVYPGPTRTAHARRYSPDNRHEARRMSPDLLAEQIVDAVARRQRELIPGWGNRGMAWLGRLLPRVSDRVARRYLFEPWIRPSGRDRGRDV